ncbi:hypothetical protein [Nocardia sp. NPDC024068]|uniref:hypothetical protein n=1 Tax=Nocardia sp. NPDC024068 TaxID=3157197 RepID=UPI0033F6638C
MSIRHNQPRPSSGPRRIGRLLCTIALGVVMVSAMVTIPGARVAAEPALCVPPAAGGPVWVNADCVDPEFDTPVIDQVEDVATPVPHHRVSGYFEGTDKRFNFYFPAKEKWQGRFFQLVYPLVDENAEPGDIEFGADSGAYTVQTNGGSGYRVDAAAAKFSEQVAADYYGTTETIHGYLWGGSGGSYQTIGAMENTVGVWDGAVPFIPGVPASIPNFFFIRAFARMVLHDKAPQIADAVSPGGSGDPYAGLDPTERSVLTEVTKLGIPLRAWEDYSYVLGLDDEQGLLGFADAVRGADPGYVEDFWNLPGYLGTEQSPLGELFRAAVVDETVTITRVERDGRNAPTELILDSVPVVPEYTRPDFVLYAPDGTEVGSLTGVLDPAGRSFAIGSGSSDDVLRAIDDVGARLRIDNRWDVALPAYARYQVPQREASTLSTSTGKATVRRSIRSGPLRSARASRQVSAAAAYTPARSTGRLSSSRICWTPMPFRGTATGTPARSAKPWEKTSMPTSVCGSTTTPTTSAHGPIVSSTIAEFSSRRYAM